MGGGRCRSNGTWWRLPGEEASGRVHPWRRPTRSAAFSICAHAGDGRRSRQWTVDEWRAVVAKKKAGGRERDSCSTAGLGAVEAMTVALDWVMCVCCTDRFLSADSGGG
jgi:hypothetical protein